MDILQELAQSRKQDLEAIKLTIKIIKSNSPERQQIIGKRPPLSELLQQEYKSQIIAEIKPASPSKGKLLQEPKNARIQQMESVSDRIMVPTLPTIQIKEISAAMYRGGATAISVLTEPRKFQGSYGNLLHIHQNIPMEMAILLKDFIIDPCQVELGALCGASNGLIIAALDNLTEIAAAMHRYGMEPLIEVHNQMELECVKKAIQPEQRFILGINNRNLSDLTIDLKTTENLIPIARKLFGENVPIITESGIETRKDLVRLIQFGINGALIGSSIMQSQDITKKIFELRGQSPIFCKICGITNPELSAKLTDPLIHAIGTIVDVPVSKRNLNPETAKSVLSTAAKGISKVIVTKDHTFEELSEMINIIQPRLIQYHGSNRNEILGKFSSQELPKMIVPVNYRETNLFQSQKEIDELPTNIFAILLDASEGNGQFLDANIIKLFVEQNPNRKFILAGGISPSNVKDIIRTIHPFGIDASSQLETNGIKDLTKITAFCQNIASAMESTQN